MTGAEKVSGKEEFLTTKEVAAMLRLAPQTVRKLAREGKLPAGQFGAFWRIRRSDLEEMFG